MEEPRFQSSDPWDAFVARYGGRVQQRVRRVLERFGIPPRPDVVADLVQEVYCRLLARGTACLELGSEPELLAYLRTTAERAVIDQLRLAAAARRNGRLLFRFGRRIRRRVERFADPQGTPEDRLLRAERRKLFLEYCRNLPARGLGRHKTWVARLAFFEGWTSREISRASGGRITPTAVHCLVHRVRRRMARDGFDLWQR